MQMQGTLQSGWPAAQFVHLRGQSVVRFPQELPLITAATAENSSATTFLLGVPA